MKKNRPVANIDKKLAVHFMETLADVAREAFLILDSNLKVVSGNQMFYEIFKVKPTQTENVFLYRLGNNQWDIPELKRLLEEILPKSKVVKDYEVQHVFEKIGKKTMLLNARQIDSVQLIILAIEDISVRRSLEEKVARNVERLTVQVAERTAELNSRVKELESINQSMEGRELKMVELKKEIANLRKQIKNGNGNHKNGRQK